MASNNEWTRVVVLTPPPASANGGSGGSIGAPLKSLFAARDWFAVEQHDPYQAMAELCLREKAQAARSGWGLQRLEKLALAIVQPAQWPALDDLFAAVRQYVPSATIWHATDDDVIPLESTPPTRKQQPPAPAKKESPLLNRAQIASNPAVESRDDAPPLSKTKSKTRDEKSAALTREEIDMLLTADHGVSEQSA